MCIVTAPGGSGFTIHTWELLNFQLLPFAFPQRTAGSPGQDWAPVYDNENHSDKEQWSHHYLRMKITLYLGQDCSSLSLCSFTTWLLWTHKYSSSKAAGAFDWTPRTFLFLFIYLFLHNYLHYSLLWGRRLNIVLFPLSSCARHRYVHTW